MFNYRSKEITAFSIKTGSTGKIRLFFLILNHPFEALKAISEFGEEQGKLEAELCSLREALAEEKEANFRLREKLNSFEIGGLYGE
jgi:dynactin complex subunit